MNDYIDALNMEEGKGVEGSNLPSSFDIDNFYINPDDIQAAEADLLSIVASDLYTPSLKLEMEVRIRRSYINEDTLQKLLGILDRHPTVKTKPGPDDEDEL